MKNLGWRLVSHPCQYIEGRRAAMLVVDPRTAIDSRLYSVLCAQGFRRSGDIVYRPHCSDCRSCIPVRVDAESFRPRRNQRRCWARNLDLDATMSGADYTDEDHLLMERYLSARHRNAGMDGLGRDELEGFISSAWSDSRFVRFRLAGRLVAVMVLDVLDDGLSAVYCFFDPSDDLSRRSLGRYCILWSINYARRSGLRWLYLGYYIPECRKMSYKIEYRPQQHLVENEWRYSLF
ncbi:MAG: arginyltransferase [Deltaproteobacteria bacterium]|nr:MAG: arginyltransferase [Deltaproteobacteria bacterium]